MNRKRNEHVSELSLLRGTVAFLFLVVAFAATVGDNPDVVMTTERVVVAAGFIAAAMAVVNKFDEFIGRFIGRYNRLMDDDRPVLTIKFK